MLYPTQSPSNATPSAAIKRRRQPSRFIRSVPIQPGKPITTEQQRALLQFLINHRTQLDISSPYQGAKTLLLEVIIQAIIDVINPRATPANRLNALAFFDGPLYGIYLNILDMPYMGFPQAIDTLLLQSAP